MATAATEITEQTPPPRTGWRAGLSAMLSDERAMRLIEIVSFIVLFMMAGVTWWVIAGSAGAANPLSPSVAAAILVANLAPATTIVVLTGRRIAVRRAAQSAVGSKGQLHVRLVASFSLVAAVPTLLVVVFASVLFQSGVQFWFSGPARSMLENGATLARGYYEEKLRDVSDETTVMSSDLRDFLNDNRMQDPAFAQFYFLQVFNRKLSESAIVEVGDDGVQRTAAVIGPPEGRSRTWLGTDTLRRLQAGEAMVVSATPGRIEAVTRLFPDRPIYLYAARTLNVPSYRLGKDAQAVLNDYQTMAENSRRLQLQFNAALYLVSLLIIGFAVWVALVVADRLVRPVTSLVHAAQRVAGGDLSARVDEPGPDADEVGALGAAFNRMTERLEQQTGALIGANAQLDSRRAFTEAVLESVTAGIVSLSPSGEVRLANSTAIKILGGDGGTVIGRRLAELAPPLAELAEARRPHAVIQFGSGPDPRTLAVNTAPSEQGMVVTFEDISQQLVDQRRAAWSDVARRIAHEIKNPLTPIQLAAERLKRRYASKIGDDDDGVFEQLTATIVRQVGDLRKIVDEFSSFARMPKPVFRPESIEDMTRHAIFLHEVAHPTIAFDLEATEDCLLVCDRRQFGQALTNVLKNAVEAIGAREESDPGRAGQGRIATRIVCDAESATITVEDNGIGLPEERDRIVEPYMTTRQHGTGLGLAVVKKIVEEHFGEIGFEDAPGGGTRVILSFPRVLLAGLDPTGASEAAHTAGSE